MFVVFVSPSSPQAGIKVKVRRRRGQAADRIIVLSLRR
jgi:hypothetical protein